MGSRARMLVKLCEQEYSNYDSIEDQSLASKTVISTTANASTVTENITSSVINTDPPPILLANDDVNDSEDEGKDFSADDSGDEYKPQKSIQRKRNNSTSSSSSSSSSSSTSSSSSSDTTSSSSSTSPPHGSVSISNLDTSQGLALSTETTVAKKGKKRVRNESAWIKNVRKRQRNSGKQYVSRTGKTVAEKSIKPPCTENCRFSCRYKITEEQRQEIFECYWGLGALQRQRDFLNSCLTTLKVPYRRVKEGAAKNRNQNCVFNFMVNGEGVRTCKFFFINTLGISERTLRTVIDSRNSSSTGVIPEDKRGKHAHHNQVNPEIIQSVRDHINSVP